MSWLPDWLTGYDSENAQRAANADAELRRLNQARYGMDYVNPDDYLNDQAAHDAIDEAFGQGLQEGRQNITGFVRGAFDFVGKTLGAVLLGIPLWAWLLAGLAVFAWLGGFTWLKRKARLA